MGPAMVEEKAMSLVFDFDPVRSCIHLIHLQVGREKKQNTRDRCGFTQHHKKSFRGCVTVTGSEELKNQLIPLKVTPLSMIDDFKGKLRN